MKLRSNVILRLLKYTSPYKIYLFFAVVSAVISVTMTLFAPIIIGDGIDLIVGAGNVDFSGLKHIILKLLTVVLIGAFFQWTMTLCTNVVSYSAVKDLRTAAFNKIQRVPLRYIDGNSHGDIISRVVNDIDQVSDGLIQGFSKVFTGAFTVIGTLLFMISINLKIALVVVVITPVSFFIASLIARFIFNEFKNQSILRGEMGGYIDEMINNQKVVKAFGYEKRSVERFKEINQKLYYVGRNAQFYSSVTNPTTRFINNITFALVGLLGAISVINGKFSIGQLSSFLNYANQYTKPFNEITGIITELQTATASARRVFAVLDEPDETMDKLSAKVLKDCKGNVDFDNVCFSYAKDKKLIENLSLTAKKGQKIAIVGPTGCGKTTLINLLMRFYDIDSGMLFVDGTETRDITRNSLRGQFGMILQESWLFSGTIKDNIAYGKPNASMEEITEAAKSAYAHSFIMHMPKGYDTLIDENGENISQGQKQLLCIARIMLTKPPMLILDEATSSIDTLTEIKVQKAFDKMMEGRTSFVVAHRLSTIKEADNILVMKDGHIVEQGNHKELLDKGGFYEKLYNSQFAPTEEV